ncbi:DUF6455 family protein [Celeribacter sp.]|uniref:DUF6455 family protein n=1 Tax=Celeribacter sp. TaxID=1890673 RepID=UPI003A95851D
MVMNDVINDTPRHGTGCLMDGMAERLGADVAAAARAGDLSREEVGDLVTRCGQCTRHDDCILWLMDHQGPQDAPPAFCLNTQELQYVRAMQRPLTPES